MLTVYLFMLLQYLLNYNVLDVLEPKLQIFHYLPLWLETVSLFHWRNLKLIVVTGNTWLIEMQGNLSKHNLAVYIFVAQTPEKHNSQQSYFKNT